jgi:hypothetical protein
MKNLIKKFKILMVCKNERIKNALQIPGTDFQKNEITSYYMYDDLLNSKVELLHDMKISGVHSKLNIISNIIIYIYFDIGIEYITTHPSNL